LLPLSTQSADTIAQIPAVESTNAHATQVRSRLLPDVVADHAGFFKVAGDMNAYLYTSSRAMHSDILNLLTGQVCGPRPNLHHLHIAVHSCSNSSVKTELATLPHWLATF